MANGTTLTANKDVDYIVKDFNSVTDALISFANVNFGPGTSRNRLWTNFNVDSFSRTWLELVAYVSDIFFFYFDVQATQAYLQTATIRSAVKDIASQFGFTPATASSASGDVLFTLTSAGVVPRGFKLVSTSGVPFFITNPITAGAPGQYTGTALQGTIKTEVFVAQGIQNEEFELAGPNVIIDQDNINPADITPNVDVSGNEYVLVDSFIRFNGQDTPVVEDSLGNVIGGGGRVFTLGERPDGKPFIRFGDGIFGHKLTVGEIITVAYRTGGGSQGNIAEDTIALQDTLPFVSTVTNPDDFSGGADEQSIEQLRQLIPASLRTLERAVAETDYSDLIVTNFNEVFAASTEPNTTDVGIDLNIYVVPQGAGITNITENSLLLTRINNFVDRRKMVTVQFQILDAFGIEVIITLEVFISDTASKTTVRGAIETALLNFFSLTTGSVDQAGIGFAEEILLKDIYSVVENIDGVERFEIKRLSYRPRINKQIQGLVTEYNTSEVTIFPTVSESEWLLAASGEVDELEGTVIFPNTQEENFSYDAESGKITYQFPVSLEGVGPGDLFRNGPGLEEETEIQTVGDGAGAFEIIKVTTVADEQGTQEETIITTRADVAADLGGTYFVIYDIAGPVAVWFDVGNTNSQPSTGANRHIEVDITSGATAAAVATALQTALNADAEFVATVFGNEVTVTNVTKLDVFDAADGSVPTDFDIEITIQGLNPDTLSGAYFDIEDDVGPVRVWFDVANGSTPPATPGGGRLLEVNIAANDPANTVATALKNAVDADAKYSATVIGNQVTITNSVVGSRTDPVDGVLATGFTFQIMTQGADAVGLDGLYFLLFDANGAIAYWFDVDDNGTAEPAHGAPRSVEITTVTSGMTDVQVATEVESAIGAGIAEITEVVCIADVSGSLNNKYFFLNSADDITEYYVWFNVSGGGTDPMIPAKTGIEVTIATNDNANAVATALASDINSAAGADFTAADVLGTVTITNDAGGAATDAADAVSPNSTGFSFNITQQGASFNVSRVGNTVTVISNDKAVLPDAEAATSGFTMTTVTQGVEDDTDFLIFAVDLEESSVYILPNQPVNPIAGVNAGGSIRNGDTSFQSFKCFKKLNATATNLSTDSITDSNIDLSVKTGTATALNARMVIDNAQVFVPGQYATGDYYLVDGSGNIWEIEDNDSNTLTTSITAVNDAAITTVSSGSYRIVIKLVGSQIVFNDSIFNIQFNSHNTIFSVGAQFTQIGTIGDLFQISKLQDNVGDLGVSVDLISFNQTNGQVRLNGSPDLSGINSGNLLIDASGQDFSVVAVDNRSLPQVVYAESNQNDELILTGAGLGTQYAQGFQVTETDTYAVATMNLRREGNVVGNLTVRIVGDDGTGLPDISDVIAVSRSVNVTTVDDTAAERTVFTFTTPPLLSSGTQYHLLLAGDVSYNGSQQAGVTIVNNTSPYTYNSLSGVVEYTNPVDLSLVLPGHFFQDNDGTLFKILNVDDANDTVTLDAGLPVIVGINGDIIANDNILLAVDNNSPTFASGELSRFNGAAWSNSTTGPDQFSTEHEAIFSLEGPKSIKIESNLTPVLGQGATVTKRYYDDENELSLAMGISAGSITSALDANPIGRGTVSGVPNTKVDHFIFRTSRIADDIINLRKMEIPQLSLSNLEVNIFGGVD